VRLGAASLVVTWQALDVPALPFSVLAGSRNGCSGRKPEPDLAISRPLTIA